MRKFFILLCCLFATGIEVFSAPPAQQIVEFRLFYPQIKERDSSLRIYQKNYLGLSVPYLFFPTPYLGLILEPSLTVIPIAQGGTKVKYFLAGMNGGGVIRALPKNWFDPMVYLTAGAAASDAGSLVDLGAVYPVTARASLNIYSIRDQYQDNTLALSVSFSGFYIARQLQLMKRIGFDVGLGLRGSF